MYHQVDQSDSLGLTISESRLEEQFRWLSENGYRSYHLSELAEVRELPSKRSVVITFDDGYVSQWDYALPLLEKYQLKATFFIPLKYVGATDAWNEPSFPLMTAARLKELNPMVVELGYHSYAHQMYPQMTMEEIEKDTLTAMEVAGQYQLPIQPILAYPYGKFPRKDPERSAFFDILKKHNIRYGFRIGNRVNTFPFKNPYEIQRIDVKGEFTLNTFKWRLKFGKWF
jgi:peptidoglycan/xylan/chitin deacetylase (PgdA/CDA1 family)